MSKQTETVTGFTPAFTPGPWAYHLGRGANPRFHIQALGGYQIASTTALVTRHTAKLALDFDENQAREANARLIAQSPAMFGLIQAIASGRYDTDAIEANAKAILAQAQGKPL